MTTRPDGRPDSLDRFYRHMQAVEEEGECVCGRGAGHRGWPACIVDAVEEEEET